jgi:hypothetical protein
MHLLRVLPVVGCRSKTPTGWHDKSPPRTRSLCLTRQVSASHEKSLPRTTTPAPTGAWAQTHGTSTATDSCGGTIPHAMQVQQLAAMQAALPNKSLNASLTGCAAITSPSPPTLPCASSARGTQAPSMTSTSLDLARAWQARRVLGQTKTNANYSEKKPRLVPRCYLIFSTW